MQSDIELRERLAATVAAVEPRPDIVQRARAGGRRRLRRHRAVTSAAVLATTAVAVLLAIGTNPMADSTPDPARPTDGRPAEQRAKWDPYRWLMTQPPRGDLVRDEVYVRDVKTVWQRSHATSPLKARGAFDNLRSEPKVAWAARTPAGRAAVVVQDAYLRRDPGISDTGGLGTLIGFVGEDAGGRARLIEDHYPEHDRPWYGFMLGRTLVVLDDGHATGYATRREYGDDGSITRRWIPLNFDDGAAIVTLPAGTNPSAVRLGRLNHPDFLRIAAQPRAGSPHSDHRAGSWQLTPGIGPHPDRERVAQGVGWTVGAADPVAEQTREAKWQANGLTRDRWAVATTAVAFDDDPFHAYAIVIDRRGKSRILHGGVPDWSAALPVAIRLPDEQGWVTVSPGAGIQYRLADGSWSAGQDNALLVPDGPGAEEVRVTRAGIETVMSLG